MYSRQYASYQSEEALGYLSIASLVEAAKAGAEAIVTAHDFLDGAVTGNEDSAVLPIVVLGRQHLRPVPSKPWRSTHCCF